VDTEENHNISGSVATGAGKGSVPGICPLPLEFLGEKIKIKK
jgi:hypothetical protein